MKQILTTILSFLVFTSFTATAQLNGKVITKDGEAIPYATVYVKDILQGTATDEKGRFTLNLRKGSYDVSFQAIGFKPRHKQIIIADKPVTIEVSLDEAVYELSQVVVSSKDNPADRIMRKAISNGQLYLRNTAGYTADVYFKNNLKINKLAAFVKYLASKETKLPVPGKLYTMEIANRITFKAPDSYSQKAISMRTNFPSKDYDVPGIELFRQNIYSNSIFGTASPLSKDAFTYYKYTLLGSWIQDGQYLFKIGIVPRKNSGPYFTGILYIADNTYNVTNVELRAKNMSIDYVFTINYDFVSDISPLPTSVTAKVTGAILGNDFSMGVTSSAKYSNVAGVRSVANTAVAIPPKTEVKKTEKTLRRIAKSQALQQKIEELEQKDKLTFSEMQKIIALSEKKKVLDDTTKTLEYKPIKVEKDSLFNTQDSTYWKNIRPIPLSSEEIKYSHESDSISAIIPKGNGMLQDSTRNKAKWNLLSLIASGDLYKKRSTKISVQGLLSQKGTFFNPVNGLTFAPKVDITTKLDSVKDLDIYVRPGYSFTSKQGMAEGGIDYNFAPRKFGFLKIDGGISTTDYNRLNPINEILTTFSTLYFKENYSRLSNTKRVGISSGIEICNGLQLSAGGLFINSSLPENNTDYSFFFKNKEYKSNTPLNLYLSDYGKLEGNQLILNVGLSFKPNSRYYFDKYGYKHYIESETPTIDLNINQGAGFISGSEKYTHLSIAVHNTQKVHMFNSLYYNVTSGWFNNSDRIPFSEFHHPLTRYTPFAFANTTRGFVLLPYYRYATASSYTEAHVAYTAQSLLIKYLPFLAHRMFTETITAGYYTTGRYKNYCEVGYGLSQLFMVGGISITTSFENGKYSSWGIKGYISL